MKNMVNIWRGHIFGINPSFQMILMLDIKSTSPCWPSYPKTICWQPPPPPAGTKSESGNMTFSCTKWKRVGDNHNKKWKWTCWQPPPPPASTKSESKSDLGTETKVKVVRGQSTASKWRWKWVEDDHKKSESDTDDNYLPVTQVLIESKSGNGLRKN